MKKELLSEISRMRELAGIISEGKVELEPGSGYIPKGMKKNYVQGLHGKNEENQMLKEDVLELKQMSKQLYSFLKGEGFPVQLTNTLKTPMDPKRVQGSTLTTQKSTVKSQINVEPVQIVVQEGKDERVIVAVSPTNVARLLVGSGDDWTHKASEKFGNDWSKWFTNSEIKNYVNKLGNELLAQIKGKYPNMIYLFEQRDNFYILNFGYGETKKGGQLDPNKVKNPNPQQQANPAIAAENRRIKELAGIKLLKEDIDPKDSVGNQDIADKVEKSLPKVEDKLEDLLNNMSDEQKTKIKIELDKLGIDDTTQPEEILSKIEGKVSDVITEEEQVADEKSVKEKVGDVLHKIGAVNIAAFGGFPAAIAIGSLGAGVGMGLAVSWGATALLMGLAKLLGSQEAQ